MIDICDILIIIYIIGMIILYGEETPVDIEELIPVATEILYVKTLTDIVHEHM